MLAIASTPGCLIGDKAYDANDVRAFLAAQGSTAVISPMPTRRNAVPFDAEVYKARNVIERSFSRLKDWRAIATRYDKKPATSLPESASQRPSPIGCIESTP